MDSIKVAGHVLGYLGNELVIDTSNTVVTTGFNYIASILASGSGYDGDVIAIGTGNRPVALSDTTMDSEVGNRQTGAKTSNLAVLSIEANFGPANPLALASITEAGLFATDGTMIARTTFAPIDKPITDSLKIIWRIRLA